MKKLSLQAAALLAHTRGGRCISTVYINASRPLIWCCAAGHQWSAAFESTRKGSWCPHCARVRRLTLGQMQHLAASHGGRCLSDRYRNVTTNLRWQCFVGHEWSAPALRVRKGHWCPFCAKAVRLSLHDFRQVAARHGGECLSLEYRNSTKLLRWKCALGHEWLARASSVKGGTWCPRCAHNQRLSSKEMHEIAKRRFGRCISANYKNGSSPLIWECSRGHRWSAAPARIKDGLWRKGTWCPKCHNSRRRFLAKRSIESMNNLARDRGGECLSREYLGSKSKLTWRCAGGHQWQALPTSIAQGTWCPVCAGNQRLELAQFQDIAARRGGFCLSQKYRNERSALLWRCALGHEWMAPPNHVKRGTWCSKCIGLNRRRMSTSRPLSAAINLRRDAVAGDRWVPDDLESPTKINRDPVFSRL